MARLQLQPKRIPEEHADERGNTYGKELLFQDYEDKQSAEKKLDPIDCI